MQPNTLMVILVCGIPFAALVAIAVRYRKKTAEKKKVEPTFGEPFTQPLPKQAPFEERRKAARRLNESQRRLEQRYPLARPLSPVEERKSVALDSSRSSDDEYARRRRREQDQDDSLLMTTAVLATSSNWGGDSSSSSCSSSSSDSSSSSSSSDSGSSCSSSD